MTGPLRPPVPDAPDAEPDPRHDPTAAPAPPPTRNTTEVVGRALISASGTGRAPDQAYGSRTYPGQSAGYPPHPAGVTRGAAALASAGTSTAPPGAHDGAVGPGTAASLAGQAQPAADRGAAALAAGAAGAEGAAGDTRATSTAAAAAAAAAADTVSRAGAAGEVRLVADAASGAPPEETEVTGPVPLAWPADRLPRLRIGSHTASRAALARLTVGFAGTGLVIGIDQHQQPFTVRFFRPEPTRVALVGTVGSGQYLVLRALALGARVQVITVDPQSWQGYGERVTGYADRVQVFMSGSDPATYPPATAQQPVLVVHDLDSLGGTSSLGPWQTQLTILGRLEMPGVRSLLESNLTLLQRLGPTEAALAGQALHLSDQHVRFLQEMNPDMMVSLGDGVAGYVWLRQTDLERRYTLPPDR